MQIYSLYNEKAFRTSVLAHAILHHVFTRLRHCLVILPGPRCLLKPHGGCGQGSTTRGQLSVRRQRGTASCALPVGLSGGCRHPLRRSGQRLLRRRLLPCGQKSSNECRKKKRKAAKGDPTERMQATNEQVLQLKVAGDPEGKWHNGKERKTQTTRLLNDIWCFPMYVLRE